MAPGFSCWTACSSRRSWVRVRRPTSSSSFSQAMSGWRRSVPVPEQGASSRIASNGSEAVHLLASAVMSSAARPARARFSPTRTMRRAEISTAVTFAPAAQSCIVLPPGAAQRSATRLPAMSPSRRTGKVAAASCTHHAPSAKPGSSAMWPPPLRRSVPVGRTSASSWPAQKSVFERGVRSSGASIRWAAAMARVVSSP